MMSSTKLLLYTLILFMTVIPLHGQCETLFKLSESPNGDKVYVDTDYIKVEESKFSTPKYSSFSILVRAKFFTEFSSTAYAYNGKGALEKIQAARTTELINCRPTGWDTRSIKKISGYSYAKALDSDTSLFDWYPKDPAIEVDAKPGMFGGAITEYLCAHYRGRIDAEYERIKPFISKK